MSLPAFLPLATGRSTITTDDAVPSASGTFHTADQDTSETCTFMVGSDTPADTANYQVWFWDSVNSEAVKSDDASHSGSLTGGLLIEIKHYGLGHYLQLTSVVAGGAGFNYTRIYERPDKRR